jgi:hypothetical protein
MGLPGIMGGIYRRVGIFAQVFQEKELALELRILLSVFGSLLREAALRVVRHANQ